MTPIIELVGTIAAAIAALSGTAIGIRAAYRRSLKSYQRSPESQTMLIDGAQDVVKILRDELNRINKNAVELQIEVARLQGLVNSLEGERDEWKNRALQLGYEEEA